MAKELTPEQINKLQNDNLALKVKIKNKDKKIAGLDANLHRIIEASNVRKAENEDLQLAINMSVDTIGKKDQEIKYYQLKCNEATKSEEMVREANQKLGASYKEMESKYNNNKFWAILSAIIGLIVGAALTTAINHL